MAVRGVLTGVRFDLSGGPVMVVHHPDGRRSLALEELGALQRRTEQERDDQQRRADEANRRMARLGQASAEELGELEKLESEPLP